MTEGNLYEAKQTKRSECVCIRMDGKKKKIRNKILKKNEETFIYQRFKYWL